MRIHTKQKITRMWVPTNGIPESDHRKTVPHFSHWPTHFKIFSNFFSLIKKTKEIVHPQASWCWLTDLASVSSFNSLLILCIHATVIWSHLEFLIFWVSNLTFFPCFLLDFTHSLALLFKNQHSVTEILILIPEIRFYILYQHLTSDVVAKLE